jgi:hypothetical protein
MRVRYGLLPSYNIGGPPTVLTVLKRLPAGIRDITVMVRCARVRPGDPAIQLVLRCNASIQFPYPMQQFYNEEGFAS